MTARRETEPIPVGERQEGIDAAADDDVFPEVRELTYDEGAAMFDQEARRLLGMSGDEFLRKWDAGEIDPDDPATHWNVMWLEGLIGFVRPHPSV